MASAPVGVHPTVSIIPAAAPANLAPAAIRANRASIAPEIVPSPIADGPQLTIVPPLPGVPAPSMYPAPAPLAEPQGTHDLANDPALAPFLLQPHAEQPASFSDSGVTAASTLPATSVPNQLAAQPAASVSFSDLFDASEATVAEPSPNTELSDMREQLAAMTELLQNRPAPSELAQVDIVISAEEQDTYGESLPLIRRVAEAHVAVVRAELTTALDGLRAEVQQALSGLQSGVGEFRKDSYTQQLRVSVPDIDQLTNHPQFQQFLAQPVPYSGGETVKSRLAAAHRGSELPKVIEIMKDFRAAVAGSTGVPVVPDITAMSVPATSTAPAAPASAQPENVRKLPWSKRQEAYREHRAGRMTAADFQKIDQAYRSADAKQMVDFLA